MRLLNQVMQYLRSCIFGKRERKQKAEQSANGLINVEPIYPSTRTLWYYNMKNSTEWEEFSDIECEIIENAFNNREEVLELDLFVINLNEFIMSMKDDKSKQYPIKRIENAPKRLRYERFCPIPEISSATTDERSFYYGVDRPKHDFSFSWQQQYFDDLPQSVELAAAGILIKGEKLGYRNEAQWIANQLLEVKHKSERQIAERCIALYTRECFLYKLLNKTLRDDDLDKHETLGPYAYLLGFEGIFKLSEEHPYSETVYRAMNLTPDQVNQYKRFEGTKKLLRWNNFVSTTKNVAKAEFFGSNTVFYIAFCDKENTDKGVDITTYSYIPDEEEVLVSPPFYFQVDSVKYDDEKKQLLIHLKGYDIHQEDD